jgi:DnaA initiator-associating protein
MQESIKAIFTESIQAHIAAGEVLPQTLEASAMTIVQSLINGNKVICCGELSCNMMAEHFAGLLVNHYETERPCLPAISLSQNHVHLDMHSYDHEQDKFSRQVRAFAQQGDLLVIFAIDGNEKSIVAAVEAALTKDMKVIAFVGDEGGELSGLLGPNDVEVLTPSKRPSRILESHLFNIHCLSQLIDNTLFPQDEQ